MSARYAIYFAPDDHSELGQFGELVLGRGAGDARSTDARSSFSDHMRWQQLTQKPSHYGFHATLKAPFELAADCRLDDLRLACRNLAKQLQRIVLTDLAPRSLHNFAALTLTHQPSELTDLASECVTALENLRAPITEQDLKRRLQQPLSNRQKSQLKAFGYPYIFEDFIFHMTLSSELGDNDQSFLQWLEEQYALHVTSDPVLDRIALFMQLDRNHEFTRIEEFCFEQANQATNESR